MPTAQQKHQLWKMKGIRGNEGQGGEESNKWACFVHMLCLHASLPQPMQRPADMPLKLSSSFPLAFIDINDMLQQSRPVQESLKNVDNHTQA